MKYVITDFGKPVELKKIDPWHGNEYTMNIYQYGIWETDGDYITNCIETSNDIEYLMNKFNTLEVLKILDK